jgi:energy-coupling factor transporter ATP-binding protein EcfA2
MASTATATPKKISVRKGGTTQDKILKPDPIINDFVLKTPTLNLIIARRGSGKSHLLRHLIYLLAKSQKFDGIHLVSPTATFNGEYDDILPPEMISSTFVPDWFEAILASQAKLIAKGIQNRLVILLDDVLGSTRFSQDIFTKIAVTGRHVIRDIPA